MNSSRHDLLLFSDIHLGSDLKRGELAKAGSFEALRSRDGLDREVAAMLSHYRRQAQARRWRLVLAGDVVDFIGMNLVPADLGEEAPFATSEEEAIWGLEPLADRCAWMMSLVCRRHPLFFEALAGFLSEGHELVVIRGNHDAALFWPEVQAVFRGALIRAGASELQAEAVRFEDWFYLEPGRIFVEHGHVHDEACSDPGGQIVDPGAPERLSQPVSTLTLRYFANRFPSLDLDNVDQWKPVDFVRWAFVKENPFRIALAFLHTMAVLLLPSLRGLERARRRAKAGKGSVSEEARQVVRRAMSRLAHDVTHAEEVAKAMASRILRTARMSVAGIMRMFCLDRVAAVGGGMALSAGSVALEMPWSVKLGLVFTLLALGFVLERYFAATRAVSIGPKLRSAADELAPHLGVPLVVMGHSHKAIDTKLANGTRYVNLGSWMPAARPGHSSSEGPGLPHLVLQGNEPAELRRWRGVQG